MYQFAHHLLQRAIIFFSMVRLHSSSHLVALYRTCTYIHYCTMHTAAPHPLEHTDIATYTGVVCLALLPKPQALFTILVNYAVCLCMLTILCNYDNPFVPTSIPFRLPFLYDPLAYQDYCPDTFTIYIFGLLRAKMQETPVTAPAAQVSDATRVTRRENSEKVDVIV